MLISCRYLLISGGRDFKSDVTSVLSGLTIFLFLRNVLDKLSPIGNPADITIAICYKENMFWLLQMVGGYKFTKSYSRLGTHNVHTTRVQSYQ